MKGDQNWQSGVVARGGGGGGGIHASPGDKRKSRFRYILFLGHKPRAWCQHISFDIPACNTRAHKPSALPRPRPGLASHLSEVENDDYALEMFELRSRSQRQNGRGGLRLTPEAHLHTHKYEGPARNSEVGNDCCAICGHEDLSPITS